MWIYLAMINIVAYILMWADKIKALSHTWRISEKTLWKLAILGGV